MASTDTRNTSIYQEPLNSEQSRLQVEVEENSMEWKLAPGGKVNQK